MPGGNRGLRWLVAIMLAIALVCGAGELRAQANGEDCPAQPASLKPTQPPRQSGPSTYSRFTPGTKQLLVLTSEQKVYTFDPV
jgi:hypothetical protein